MKRTLRFLAAGLALLIGSSIAGFAQPAEHFRNDQGIAMHRSMPVTQYRGDGDHDRDDVKVRRDRDDRFVMPWQFRRDHERDFRRGDRDGRGFDRDRR